MNKLFVVEGADGTGKTTLCNEIVAQTKGHLLHASFDKEWNITQYHTDLFSVAVRLLKYQDVVLDRWAVSEEVYANAFRDGAKYSADTFMDNLFFAYGINKDDVEFIYCTTKNVVENHNSNKKIREEMFDTMEPVHLEYEKYMAKTAIEWTRYDYTKEGKDVKKFVEGLL